MSKNNSLEKQVVLEFLLTLPQNKVTTYKALAEKFNTHPRAIATYMRTNKDYDIYPCYKVISSDFGLSGYILGVPEKEKRLRHDGISIVNGKVIANNVLTIL